MLDVLSQDYIRVALAKGVAPRDMLISHALKNALIPVITLTAINFAYLVGTTITIEFIFAIPGVGSALIQAVTNRDFPVIQGLTLVIALFFIGMNILADVLYAVVDPRVVYS
jgi:peptide/nickel transport system permease protein